jgi:hypothetical protein
LRRPAPACLQAIREIATPADLNELFALWPLVERDERRTMLRTIEMVSAQRFDEVPINPNAATGPWQWDIGLQRVDDWVGGACATVDGTTIALGNIGRLSGAGRDARAAAVLARALRADIPSVWPVATELLTAFGGPAVNYDRSRLDNPKNEEAVKKVLERFPVSGRRDETPSSRQHTRRKGAERKQS